MNLLEDGDMRNLRHGNRIVEKLKLKLNGLGVSVPGCPRNYTDKVCTLLVNKVGAKPPNPSRLSKMDVYLNFFQVS